MLQMRPNFLAVMPEDVTSLIRYILEDEGYDISTPEGVGHDSIRDRDNAVDLVILGVAFYERQNAPRPHSGCMAEECSRRAAHDRCARGATASGAREARGDESDSHSSFSRLRL